VKAFDVPAAECAAIPPSLAVLPERPTPTGAAVAPWAPDQVLVGLWNTAEIAGVPTSTDARPHVPTVVVDSIDHQQHLLADGRRALVTDHT
jgi:hypothetical protein